MSDEKANMLKRFQDALAGRRLSGVAAHQINEALCEGRPYRHLCEQDEKLQGILRERLQEVVDRMTEDGVTPAASLLTPHQQKATERRNA